ncbi:type II toxin-antitoxin system RelE/ParE family toxin [Bradyrhizobium sp.]|uniref:type II toxin-antitoxin system RelE/ParE family toxin n=1 Tax=Bradyrhizobium sp. TaxID=376 RepID=UPI0040377298
MDGSSNSVLRALAKAREAAFACCLDLAPNRAVFLYGFAKNERENISNSDLLSLREIAATFLNASQDQIARALRDGSLIEVYDEGKDEEDP